MQLVVIAHDPPVAAVADHALGAGLGGRAVLDLHVEVLGIAARQQFLLQRLPIGGVVDVIGDVALGGAERPRRAAVDGLRGGMAQPGADAARRHPAVGGHLGLGQRRRAPVLGVEVHPQRDGLHVGRGAGGAVLGDDVRAALGPHPSDAAAERGQGKALAEAGEAVDADPCAPHHPHRRVLEPGILDIAVGHVLQPAGQRVEADAARRRAVREPRPAGLAERAHVGVARQKRGVRTAHSMISCARAGVSPAAASRPAPRR